MSNYKTCYKCKSNKKNSEFYSNKNMCKVCCREYARNYYYSKKVIKDAIQIKPVIEIVYVPAISNQKTLNISSLLKYFKC